MNRFSKILLQASSLLAAVVATGRSSFACGDEAQSSALQAADPYVKQGLQVREGCWGGERASSEKKAVRQQLCKGYEYLFWLGTAVARAKVSLHIYDSDGKLAE